MLIILQDATLEYVKEELGAIVTSAIPANRTSIYHLDRARFVLRSLACHLKEEKKPTTSVHTVL
jgi:hypothetical protein